MKNVLTPGKGKAHVTLPAAMQRYNNMGLTYFELFAVTTQARLWNVS